MPPTATTDLPNLKDLQLFNEMYTLLKREPMSLNALARRLLKSPSTVSACVSALEQYYGRGLIEFRRGVAAPSEAADEAVKVFLKIIRLARTLQEEGEQPVSEIRVATTVSLKHRLFPGPLAAFQMWLRHAHAAGYFTKPPAVRVVVDSFDHTELLQRMVARGVHAYHWGVCWQLPQAEQHTYLDFHPIPIKKEDHDLCRTAVLAIGLEGPKVKWLSDFPVAPLRGEGPVPLADLLDAVPTLRLAVVQTEPEDDLRVAVMRQLEKNTAVTVRQYEEALQHIRCLDSDLMLGPGWYRFRHYVRSRAIRLDDGELARRAIQLVHRKPISYLGEGTGVPLADADLPVRACYCIFRLFLTDFARELFIPDADGDKAKDPSFTITPAEIAKWVDGKKDGKKDGEKTTDAIDASLRRWR